MMNTALTPAMERMALLRKDSESEGSADAAGAEELRHIVTDAIDKSIFGTATFLAECLLRLPGSNDADAVLFAKCYFLQGQPRRCLAALENRGLLSATNIGQLVEFLESPDGLESNRLRGASAGCRFMAVLGAVQLAAICLLNLEQFEDCLALLESVVSVDAVDEDMFKDIEGAKGLRLKAQKLREAVQILVRDKPISVGGNDNNTMRNFELNPLSGIYCTLGKCLDLLENRPLAVRAFVTAAAVDAGCTEAVDYITSNSLLSVDQRVRLYRFLRGQQDVFRDRTWLDGFYRYALLGEDTDGVPFEQPPNNNANNDERNDARTATGGVFVPINNSADRPYHRNNEISGIGSDSIVFKSLTRGGLPLPVPENSDLGGELSFSAMSTSSTIPLTPGVNSSTILPTSAQSSSSSGNRLPEASLRVDSTPLSTYVPSTSESLSRAAERKFNDLCCEDAYRLARQAYTVDPFDQRGLQVYIASMTELGLKTELFYLGHELTTSHPKSAVSWYAVGCYYYCCGRFELAQKYLMKSTKLDKRYAKAWVALGHSLSAQEESEHAIAAFRTASRLLPGDHRPILYMAKELVRTSYFSLALHLLSGALKMAPSDPTVLNELGVAFLKVDRLDDALKTFSRAVDVLDSQLQLQPPATSSSSSSSSSSFYSSSSSTNSRLSRLTADIYNNLATVLRKSGKLPEALEMYNRCLALDPNDGATHAHIAFTLHLMEDFDKAISAYHRSLALNPLCTFCSDMLSKAMSDAAGVVGKPLSNNWTSSADDGLFRTDGGSVYLPEAGLEFLTEAWQ